MRKTSLRPLTKISRVRTHQQHPWIYIYIPTSLHTYTGCTYRHLIHTTTSVLNLSIDRSIYLSLHYACRCSGLWDLQKAGESLRRERRRRSANAVCSTARKSFSLLLITCIDCWIASKIEESVRAAFTVTSTRGREEPFCGCV